MNQPEVPRRLASHSEFEREISLITKGLRDVRLRVEGDAWVLVMKYQKECGRAFQARSMLGSAQCGGWTARRIVPEFADQVQQ
jgi:hypothetical protein